jgi:glycosyltransferase involved in cell wall biosynthesis
MTLALVVPFLNEERYLPQLLDSLLSQCRRPDLLLLVDDGSTDRSRELAAEFADAHHWARVVRRRPRPSERDRLARAAELRAFESGLDALDDPYDVVAKLDADMSLPPNLLYEVGWRFRADPHLGITGPYVSRIEPDGARRRQSCPPGHVEGHVKFYRRACYDQIAPLPATLGWDTIDEVRARMRGWRAESFELPGGDPEHLRRMGSHDGILRGYRRAGLAAYGYGAHPAYVLLSAAVRAPESPWLLCGAAYLVGYATGVVWRVQRADPNVRAALRKEESARIRSIVLGWRRE